MPSETWTRIKTTDASELALPPPFTLVTLREVGDAFAHAMSIAAKQGAGTLVYVGRFDLAELAVVLEPEQPLRQARCAFYAGMVALANTLTAHAQPETSISHRLAGCTVDQSRASRRRPARLAARCR